MEKAKVIKALELCGHISNPHVRGISACEGCPYIGMDNCDEQMCKDAISLLKANDAPMYLKPKYTIACIYTKKGDLLPYLYTDKVCYNHFKGEPSEGAKMMYARERDIQLIALFRWEGNKVFCKIKCPVNPLPIKGEFEAASMAVLDKFLKANGWSFKQKFYPRMFE